MDRAVTISADQFEVFKSVIKAVPGEIIGDLLSQYGEIDPLDRMIPPIHEVGDRTIWYNKKNLQFKFDDTFHMVSKYRRYLKKLRHNGATPVQRSGNFVAIVLSLRIANLVLH